MINRMVKRFKRAYKAFMLEMQGKHLRQTRHEEGVIMCIEQQTSAWAMWMDDDTIELTTYCNNKYHERFIPMPRLGSPTGIRRAIETTKQFIAEIEEREGRI